MVARRVSCSAHESSFDETQSTYTKARAGNGVASSLSNAWPILKRSHLLHVQQVRILMLDLRDASARVARTSSKESASWLRQAQLTRVRCDGKESLGGYVGQLLEAAIQFPSQRSQALCGNP